MNLGEWLTLGTVRAALALYVLALALRLLTHGGPRPLSLARLAWTAGCVAFLVHVGCAFHFYHGWSHAAAYESTARRTEEVVGLAWGGGLFANYAFALVWVADAAWWWVAPTRYSGRSRVIEFAVQGFLGFIAFNASVVFGAGSVRWGGVAACALLAALGLYAGLRRTGGRHDGASGVEAK